MPEEEILTMEPVEDAKPRFSLTPERAKLVFLSLAVLAGLALFVAVLAIALAPDGAVAILVIALVVLALVVIAEIVLLLLAKPRNA